MDYDRLAAEDEKGIAGLLQACRKHLVNPTIGNHHGFFLECGDARMLIEFAGLTDVVNCALALQKGLKERNAKFPPERQIRFRAGIHVGEVLYENDVYFGNAISVSSDLRGLAEPGGICISEVVHQSLKDKIDLPIEDMGDREFEHAGVMRVFHLPADGGAKRRARGGARDEGATEGTARKTWIWATAAAIVVGAIGAGALLRFYPQAISPFFGDRLDQVLASAEPLALPDKPSIAVLPFTNLRGDRVEEYFTNGLTNDIIADLAKFENLFVIASDSAFVYKGKRVRARNVRDQLGVRYLLAGDVNREDETLRVSVQLIDTTKDSTLWAERYEGKLGQSLSVHDEIVAAVVQAMKVKGDKSARQRAQRRDTDNLKAYDYYLRGRDLRRAWTKEANVEAGFLYQKAARLDPNFARAYSALAVVNLDNWRNGWSDSPEQSLERAYEMAKRSVALNKNDALAHKSLAFVHLYRKRFDKALATYKRARALSPNDADLVAEMAETLVYLGKPEEAIALINRAMRINPFYRERYLTSLGWASYHAERYEEALEALERMKNPPVRARKNLAATYAKLGRIEEAGAIAEEILESEPGYSLARELSQPYKDQADLEHWLDGLRQAGLPE